MVDSKDVNRDGEGTFEGPEKQTKMVLLKMFNLLILKLMLSNRLFL